MSDTTLDLFTVLQGALGPQYRLERELGRGGMGVVFLATDVTLDRRVAIKVVHPELAPHEAITRRFLTEARTIARLRHPNIVAIHAAGTANGLLYYVMDEIAGESLRQRLVREGRLDPAETARIVADLAAALDAASRAGVVHRDVKPENVLLDGVTGRALLADFGIARAMAVDASVSSTGQGVAVGTPLYMSPEQAIGEEVDSRSDVYSLGVLAYEMLAGHPPFQGPHRIVVSKHIAERPIPIERLRPETTRPLAAAIMRALEKQPSDRWQTGEEFRQAVLGERDTPARQHRLRRRLLMAGAAALVIGAATVALVRRGSGPPAGVNPRHSILVLPFDNLRDEPTVEWLRDGSVSMLGLNLSQWKDLTVVDHERMHDLLARHGLRVGQDIGLDMARRLAREAGVWTVVLGDFTPAGDSLHLTARVYDVASGKRVDVARADGRPGADVRPLFDELAAKLLDLSGAPNEIRIDLANSTTKSLQAFRAFLSGVEQLNRWELAGAERDLQRAIALDTTFGLAYYKLALTRGWLVGLEDSISTRAIRLATAYSGNLPADARTVINAYRAMIGGEYSEARSLYQQLLSRNSDDADAWYGLGDAWFHDTTAVQARAWTQSLRAFKRALALDPNYALAYEHVQMMLGLAAGSDPLYALLPKDSFALTRGSTGRPLLDSATTKAAVQRARSEALASARSWVSTQPTTFRAHDAMVNAYVAAGNYSAALSEVERFRDATPLHPELPFMEARVRFASGDVDRAATQLRTALDTVMPVDFRNYAGTTTVVHNIAAAANVFAYQGDLVNAAKALDLADRVRREVTGHPESATGLKGTTWKRAVLGELYAAAGGPAPALRQVWQGAAEAARMAPAEQRRHIAHSGATAANGLFTGLAADTTALHEFQAISGEPPAREIRALLAVSRGDSAEARQVLAEPDTARGKYMYTVYSRPYAAQAYYLLGDYETALQVLEGFQPSALQTAYFDSRWAMMGRVRLLRGAAYERLGRRADAREEYRRALTQWRSADPALQPYIQQAQRGLARMGEPG